MDIVLYYKQNFNSKELTLNVAATLVKFAIPPPIIKTFPK